LVKVFNIYISLKSITLYPLFSLCNLRMARIGIKPQQIAKNIFMRLTYISLWLLRAVWSLCFGCQCSRSLRILPSYHPATLVCPT